VRVGPSDRLCYKLESIVETNPVVYFEKQEDEDAVLGDENLCRYRERTCALAVLIAVACCDLAEGEDPRVTLKSRLEAGLSRSDFDIG
jgi:hypothetical protein